MCSKCRTGACEIQKGALDPPEVELGMVASDHMGAGDQSQILCKNMCF